MLMFLNISSKKLSQRHNLIKTNNVLYKHNSQSYPQFLKFVRVEMLINMGIVWIKDILCLK